MEREDGHYEIHDYKTSGSLPEQARLDHDRQLALYEIGVRAAWPDVREVDFVWHYVVFDKDLRSRRTPEQLEVVKRDTVALINVIESETAYPPTESTLCQWCNYQDICPLFAHRTRIDLLPVNKYLKEEGVTLVNTFAALDAQKKALNAQVKEIESEQEKIKEAAIAKAAKENVTRLFGSDKVLTIKDDIKVTYPRTADPNRSDFVRRMVDMGLWDVVTDISWPALKKIAKNENWASAVPEGLREFVTVEADKRISLGGRKDKGEL